jgi:selenocysteine lyase/cysteine desulfurase
VSGDVYLDNAATSWPKPPAVLEAITEFLERAGGNTGRSGHHRSIASSRAVSLARERLAELLGVESPDELIFTKNGTEGLNLAIYGLAEGVARIVTTSLEHNSVMRPLRDLEERGRCTVEVVHTDGNTGEIDLDEWKARLRAASPALAVATHASNVTGRLLPRTKPACRSSSTRPRARATCRYRCRRSVPPPSRCPGTRACSGRRAPGSSTSRRPWRSSR